MRTPGRSAAALVGLLLVAPAAAVGVAAVEPTPGRVGPAGATPLALPAVPTPVLGALDTAAPAPTSAAAATGAAGADRCDPPPADLVEPTVDAARLLRLAAVHRFATGAGQTVAVIDTGVASHERLAGRLQGAGDLLGGGDGRIDCDGHGTAVAGLLAAAPGSEDDLVGMAPAATVLTIRQTSRAHTVTGSAGRARPAGDVVTLARAVETAVQRGASVINLSEAACLSPERADRDASPLGRALRRAAERDVVVVAAAGNLGVGGCTGGAPVGEVSLPGWFGDDVLTVAATLPDGAPAPFTVPGPWVDVAAPGTGLRSLAVGGGLTGTGVEGTSFAAPWVAGLAALIRERFPELRAGEIVDRIVATARRPAGGWSPVVGHGLIDPLAALTAEPALLRPDPDPAARTVLAGTAPADPPPTPRSPVELLALVALAGAAGAGAASLRRAYRP